MMESAHRGANRWNRPQGPGLLSAYPVPVRPVSPSVCSSSSVRGRA